MENPVLMLAIGLLGLLVGVIATAAFRFSENERRQDRHPPEPSELPEGVGAVLSVLRSAAVVVNERDEVVKASAAAYAFGLVREGKLTHKETLAMVQQVRSEGAIFDGEYELLRGPVGNRLIFLQIRVAPLGSKNVVVLAEDRTQSHRLEEIRRDFVANVSHELKTPVGAISLLAETVSDAADDPEAVRRFAGRMHKESVRLSALVQEIIELSRTQVADAFTELEPVHVDKVLAEAVDRVRFGAQAQDVDIEIGGVRDATVLGDYDMLVTAVRNLAENAINYSDSGTHIGVGVTISDGFVEISVTDRGIGIPEADRERVFERFYRVDPARARATGGTGLGLSIVKHIALNHGGEVTLWSSPGHGSTFTIRIPQAPTELSGIARGDAA